MVKWILVNSLKNISNFNSNLMLMYNKAVPAALSGRDVIGIAATGSGKTAAFLLPMITHIMDQPHLVPGDGPIGLICAPTRELCMQIHTEAKRFGKPHGINVVSVFGGAQK